MADALTTVTNFISSPPGQLVAGGVLAGIVWKFFERVEAVLNENTKLEIAVWLLGVKIGRNLEPWPETFAKLFDRVFGFERRHFPRFGIVCVATVISTLLGVLIAFTLDGSQVVGIIWGRGLNRIAPFWSLCRSWVSTSF